MKPQFKKYLYFRLAAACVVILVAVVMTFFSSKAKKEKSDHFAKNPKEVSLSAQQQHALAVGLLLSEQNKLYCNTLETGDTDTSGAKDMLRDWWDITDATTAKTDLDDLMKKGHRTSFNYLITVFLANKQDTTLTRKEVEAKYPQDVTLSRRLSNLFAVVNQYHNTTFPLTQDNLKKGVDAWDYGRVVTLARFCYQVHYLTEQEAWTYIMNADKEATPLYSNWKEFATSYLIGKAIWGGNTSSLTDASDIATKALNDAESPWNHIAFK